jgi:hypothetical protein
LNELPGAPILPVAPVGPRNRNWFHICKLQIIICVNFVALPAEPAAPGGPDAPAGPNNQKERIQEIIT